MASCKVETLLKQLVDSQSQLCSQLTSVIGMQDWQPGPEEWSLRFLAAHLAATEQECFQERIQRIATGNNPSFEYYSNSDRDFSNNDLRVSLDAWCKHRQDIFDIVRGLPDKAWSLIGIHAVNGPITIWDVLVSMMKHDREHQEGLQQALFKFRN